MISMDALTREKKEEIIKILTQKGIKVVCPMCGNKNFVVADGYFNDILQSSLGTFNIGGPSIPSIPIVCTNCGYISQHALGVLGLLAKSEEEKNDK